MADAPFLLKSFNAIAQKCNAKAKAAVAFRASSDASYTTGKIIGVKGGVWVYKYGTAPVASAMRRGRCWLEHHEQQRMVRVGQGR